MRYTCSYFLIMKKLFWLNPEGFSHEITWDSSMCSESERNSEFKELFSNAFKQKLLPIQQQVMS